MLSDQHQHLGWKIAVQRELANFLFCQLILSSSLPAMAAIMDILITPLKVFEGLGLSPFQAFVVIGMLTSGAIMNWTYNFNNHDDDDSDHEE